MKAKRILTLALCLLLTAALVFSAGCGKKKTVTTPEGEAEVMGEGEKVFTFTVTDAEDESTLFEIHTDKDTVGEALQELELIDGEEGQYGLYVKTVNDITADADKDGAYWAFYTNGEPSSYGVDMTDVVDGDSYAFIYEKL